MTTKRRRITLLVLTLILVLAMASAAVADTWSTYGSCLPGWDLKVQSYATGTVQHFKNGVQTGKWYNYSTPRWRTTYQGYQGQEVVIYTTGSLTAQNVSCVCLPGHQCAQAPSQ
jgi:hypothetical protein